MLINVNVWGGGVTKIKSDNPHKDFFTAIRELRELGFELIPSDAMKGQSYLEVKQTRERIVGSWLYQVVVEKKRNKIEIEIYCFIDGEFKMRWTKAINREKVPVDIMFAINHRIEYGSPLPTTLFRSVLCIGSRKSDIE